MNHFERIAGLERQLEARRLDGILIGNLANVRYLCGFTGSSGQLAFARGEWAFFTDGRYTEQARKQVKGAQIHVEALPPLTLAANWLAGKCKRARSFSRIGIESEHLTLSLHERFNKQLRSKVPASKYRLIRTDGVVEQFRIQKDKEEVALIRSAVQLASSVFSGVLKSVRAANTENDVAAELEHLARRAGAEKMSFETIVAAGMRSAMPHARPTRERIGSGFVVLDYGVILGGYCSDMTRSVYVGRAKKWERELYASVLEAQLAGIAAVRAGVEAQEVDAAARSVLKCHKFDRYFTHSLGHGVGLEIHEAPRLAKGQTLKLEAGMVVTIEPGAYIPGRGGVRIEDMVLVTANGCEVLTPTPKEFVTC